MPPSTAPEGVSQHSTAGEKSRREFIEDVVQLGLCVTPLALAGSLNAATAPSPGTPAASAQAPAAITATTIQEAQKVHALHFSPAECEELAAALPAQVSQITALRQLARPRALQPALHFDPRLPGAYYPRQNNILRLTKNDAPAMPQDDAALCYAPITHLSHWIRSKQLSSLHLTELYLQRIEAIAPRLYCYITVCADVARAQAKAMDTELTGGRYRGPLHGVPYSLKDVFDTAAIPTTWGCALYRDRVPSEDASIVQKLRDAGAVLLGKAAMGELANGWQWYGGSCRNPWNPEEPAGGSSAGSAAATAAGLCAFSIGTDSLGSILNPADRCGIVGLRPTYGRVPVNGSMPLTPSLERIGPLCRGVEDAAIVLASINGFDPSSASSIDAGFAYDAATNLRTLRVGYSPKWFGQVGFEDQQTAQAATAELQALQALRDLGVTLVPIELPDLPYTTLLDNLFVEAAAVFEELTLNGQDALLVNKEGWPLNWRKARLLSAVDYLQIERFRRQVMQQMHALFETVDVVFGPTYGSFDLFLIMNYTGQPGVTLRAGFAASPSRSMVVENFFSPADAHGPTHLITRNVTFHGRLFEEGKMLAVARALESRLGVWQRPPPIA